MEKSLPISNIKVGRRHRKTFGDLKGLAYSIKTLGLLQAIGVTKDGHQLVFGERRLRAVKMNGEKMIDCRILDIDDILKAEHAENEFRESLTLTEKHALAKELEKKVPRRPMGRGDAKKLKSGQPGQTLAKGGVTRDEVAYKAGFSSPQQMRRVNKVVDKGVPELVEAMDKGEVPLNTAARLAEKPKVQQKRVMKEVSKNGKSVLRKTVKGKSQAVLWTERLNKIMYKVWGLEEQYGSVKDMMESDLWASSTTEEKEKAIDVTISAHEELGRVVKEMKAYMKTW